MSLVVDASMAVAWLFDDEHTNAAHNTLLRVAAEGAIVPSLWRLEVANVLRNAVRKGRCDEGYVDESLARLARLPIEIDDETDLHAWGETLRLSREESLTPYDATYLELALRRKSPLASGDGDLIRAARKRAVEVISV